LGEPGDVIETQTIRFSPSKFFNKLGPCLQCITSTNVLPNLIHST